MKNMERTHNTAKRIMKEALLIAIMLFLLGLAILNLNETSFSVNQITGGVISRVNITAAPPIYCNFTLEAGWNLVSFFCIMYEDDRDDVIENITQLSSIFEYQEGASDPWKSYNPDLPSWVVQDLEKMYRVEGYWIDVNNTESVVIPGGLYIPSYISLVSGWNLAGYPTNETKTVANAFLSLDGNFTEVRAFNATTKGFYNYIPPATGPMGHTNPPHGYWINATTSEVWEFE